MDLLYPVVLLLSIILTTFNRGFFSLPSFAILCSLLVLLYYMFFREIKYFSVKLLTMVFLITYTLFMFNSSGIYEINNSASLFLTFLPLLFFPLVLTYAISHPSLSQSSQKKRFIFLILLALIIRLLMITASPNPVIDVFTILKEAPVKVLSFINPYNTVYTTVYAGQVLDYFPYWPVSFLLQIPFVMIFNDPRVLLIMADILSAVLLYLIGKKTRYAETLSLIYLFRPNSNFIIEQSWLTPLTFFFVILSFYFLMLKKDWLGGLISGLLIGIQPIFAVLVPFYCLMVKNIRKFLLAAITTVSIFITPFMLWDSTNFFDKTIAVYFKDPKLVPTIPVYMSLNLNTFIHFVAGRDIPAVLSIVILSILLLFILKTLYSLRLKLTSNKEKYYQPVVFLGAALFFLSFYFLFRQAFINYYFLISDFIILWGVIKWRSYYSS